MCIRDRPRRRATVPGWAALRVDVLVDVRAQTCASIRPHARQLPRCFISWARRARGAGGVWGSQARWLGRHPVAALLGRVLRQHEPANISFKYKHAKRGQK
eukprot:4111647-Alexandrium_andersonii.AAC.1